MLLLVALGCGGPQIVEPGAADRPGPPAGKPEPLPELGQWAAETASPGKAQPEDDGHYLLGQCQGSDLALTEVATGLAEGLARGQALRDTAAMAHDLRRFGAPYVWPRAWSLSGASIEPNAARERAAAWLSKIPVQGQSRCGAAHVRLAEGSAAVLLLSDVLAELAPVPSRARAGEWLEVRAQLLVSASDAKVVVLGSRGAPKPVPTTLSNGVVRARFAPSEPGVWLVQVLATVAAGPRPVAEAMVFAEVAPVAFQARSAPGEDAGGSGDPSDALFAMLNGARRLEGLPPLSRDPRLDLVAREHSDAMAAAGVLGHDVGHGGVGARLEAAGLGPSTYGENIARAESPARAHRVIWASPSHRGNLLDQSYRAVGVAVVEAQKSVWVTEVFATFP